LKLSTIGRTDNEMLYDGYLKIAVGNSRKETHWKNIELKWSNFVEQISVTTRTPETQQEYQAMKKEQQDNAKDIGGFIGGPLIGEQRKKDNVEARQLITLDADFIDYDLFGYDFFGTVQSVLECACAIYSTHKHSPERPRFRLVVPLSRPVTPEEYVAISRLIANDIGIDFFDDTTYQPHRLMYWPSTSKDGEFIFKYQDAPWLDPDKILGRYPDWKDPANWPESSRMQKERKKLANKQGDPLSKPGLVGAFCRTYSVTDAISEFLTEIYEPAGDDRYTYRMGSTTGGLVIYENDKFAYSHHGTDPIGGKLANAFDLVRLHKFGNLDEEAEPGTPTVKLPSYLSMIEFAQQDSNVRRTIGEERLLNAAEEFKELQEEDQDTSWLENLDIKKNGQYVSSAKNVLIILQNDPRLANKIALNSFSNRPVILGDLPWRKIDEGEYWQDRDDSSLRNYLEQVYDISSHGKINDALMEVEGKNKFHPIRDYITSLSWDGQKRIDTLLVDYLGAGDNAYVRAVTRKLLVAAVARVFAPGIKFDNVLVLVGPQGIGKSYLIKLLGKQWHSDSVITVKGKEAFEQLQGAWLIELAELSATRKAEAEAVKHFISKQEDAYRPAYGRQLAVFPRQCVFFGTTNDFIFLRDKTGNRRFWPVEVGKGERVKSLWKDLTENEVDQIWAEAFATWQDGETLVLEKELEEEAFHIQEIHTEESEKYGLILEYLQRELPEDWDNLDVGARRQYLHGNDFGEVPEGNIQRTRVCAMEVWVELFHGDPKQLTPMQSREITDILRRIPGWVAYSEKRGRGRLYFGKLYGHQKAFVYSPTGI
jgi:putative DNA primase/helicase